MHFLIIGGGINGLASAFRLVEAGAKVTVLEASDQLGGLGTFFQYDGRWIDRFYHTTTRTDVHLHRLIDDIGMTEQLYWKTTRMGFAIDGERYPFNTPIDLLRFGGLSFVNRIKLGAVSVLLRRLGEGKDLDDVRAEDWLKKLYGETIWEKIWKPMFGAKFGDRVGNVPARYLWQRLGRESNVATRGYFRCGYKGVIDRLAEAIRERGGDVRTETPVATLRQTGDEVEAELPGGQRLRADWAIATTALPILEQMIAETNLAPQLEIPELTYQGVVNALFFMKRPLDGNYWMPIIRSGTDYDGLIEMSALVDRDYYGGRHLAYVMKYTERSSALFQEADASIAERWTDQLIALYDDLGLTRDDISDVIVFKAPFVEPLWPLGYGSMKPGFRVGDSRLFMATTAQIYPHITAWNSSVRLIGELLAYLDREIDWRRQSSATPAKESSQHA